MSREAQLALSEPVLQTGLIAMRARVGRKLACVLLLALAYYGTAKLGQTLRYTASVSAIWPPAGFGIGALYLWGLRWWPGIFFGEVLVNTDLLLNDNGLPFWSVVGQQTGNMLEILVGAILLRRLIGPKATLDRADQILGMFVALATATAISAMVGTISMLAGGVIESSEASTFLRTWWLGDTAGGLVALPLMLTWAHDPAGSWRRIRTWEGALLVATVCTLGVISVSDVEPVTYMVFPALIWAALRFGPAGATLSIAIAAGVAIGFTANEVGPFFKQPIDQRTLSTQLYIGVAALTTLLLSALVSERGRSISELAQAKRREGERALEERHRIARDLHDSVSQALFSTVLHVRTVGRALDSEGVSHSGPLGRAVTAIGDLTVEAQRSMRALLFELNGGVADQGLVAELAQHASNLRAYGGPSIEVHGPQGPLPLSPTTETHLLAIGREALVNVAKHSAARRAWVRVEVSEGGVSMEIRDNGTGFDSAAGHPGHYGLESMRSRAGELGAVLTIRSRLGGGTVVRVEAQADREVLADGP
jgi:signal transduction histidine kinase